MKTSRSWEALNDLLNIEELRRLVLARSDLRLLYQEMQTAAHATNNPLFQTLMETLAKMGNQANADIQSWFDRVQTEHGEPPEEGGEAK